MASDVLRVTMSPDQGYGKESEVFVSRSQVCAIRRYDGGGGVDWTMLTMPWGRDWVVTNSFREVEAWFVGEVDGFPVRRGGLESSFVVKNKGGRPRKNPVVTGSGPVHPIQGEANAMVPGDVGGM